MYGELDRMLSLGVIEHSESPWNNRVTFVQKGDKVRICLDARRLNDLTVKEAYPLPNIKGLLSQLGDTHYIYRFEGCFLADTPSSSEPEDLCTISRLCLSGYVISRDKQTST